MRGFLVLTLSLGLLFAKAEASPGEVAIYQTLTSSVALIPLRRQTPGKFKPTADPGVGRAVFVVNPLKKFQRLDGFGAALTESCVMTIMRLSSEQRAVLLRNIFSKTGGAGFDMLRFPLGSTDFSDPARPNFTYDDAPAGQIDPGFRFFDMSRDEKSFSLIREARAINPGLQVMVTPWSAPAWMKTNQNLKGGTLAPEHAADFARYLVKSIRELQKRDIPVTAMTIQNEPGYANEWYPSMGMSGAEQASFIGDHLGPLLRERRLPVRIFALDHNWEMSQDTVLPLLDDARARSYIGGVAYHCYGGWRGQMRESMDRYPEIPTLQTECSGLLDSVPDGDFHWWLQNQSLDAVKMGTTGALGWNLCLDQEGGPRNHGCKGCRGLVTIDSSHDPVEVRYNPEFHALAQVSRFIRPGSRRIAVLDRQLDGTIQAVAFENEDRSLVFVAENTGLRNRSLQIRLLDGKALDYELPGGGAATFQWQP